MKRFNTRWDNFKRAVRYFFQRRSRGFDGSELWALDYTIAKFTIPRLKAFRDGKYSHPIDMTPEKWDECIGDMIYALEVCVREGDGVLGRDDADWERVNRGLELFGTRFRDLWS